MKIRIPSDDDLCRMAAKVIMKMHGFDAERAFDCARTNLQDRRRRRLAAQKERDRATRCLW